MQLTEVEQWIVLNLLNVTVTLGGAVLYVILFLRALLALSRLSRRPLTPRSVILMGWFNAAWAIGNGVVSLAPAWLGGAMIRAALTIPKDSDVPDYVIDGTRWFLATWVVWGIVAVGAYWFLERVRDVAEDEAGAALRLAARTRGTAAPD